MSASSARMPARARVLQALARRTSTAAVERRGPVEQAHADREADRVPVRGGELAARRARAPARAPPGRRPRGPRTCAPRRSAAMRRPARARRPRARAAAIARSASAAISLGGRPPGSATNQTCARPSRAQTLDARGRRRRSARLERLARRPRPRCAWLRGALERLADQRQQLERARGRSRAAGRRRAPAGRRRPCPRARAPRAARPTPGGARRAARARSARSSIGPSSTR